MAWTGLDSRFFPPVLQLKRETEKRKRLRRNETHFKTLTPSLFFFSPPGEGTRILLEKYLFSKGEMVYDRLGRPGELRPPPPPSFKNQIGREISAYPCLLTLWPWCLPLVVGWSVVKWRGGGGDFILLHFLPYSVLCTW